MSDDKGFLRPPCVGAPRLLELLDLETIDRNLYRGIGGQPDMIRANLYGGQVAAQALMAAARTVPEGRTPHSLHGYFLRPGRLDLPVIFHVERDRDGRSFSARRVSAVQDGAVIFDLSASFQESEAGGDYVTPIRNDVPDPDDCPSDPFSFDFPAVDARMVDPVVCEDGREHSSTIWVRIPGSLGDDPLVHACSLVYLSDIGTGFFQADIPGVPKGGPSIDHAMWFRAPMRADEWVLQHMWPLMAGGARGLYVGSMHQIDGTHGVTFTQESLLRRRG